MIVFIDQVPHKAVLDFWYRCVYLTNTETGMLRVLPFTDFGGDAEVGEHGELDMNYFNAHVGET